MHTREKWWRQIRVAVLVAIAGLTVWSIRAAEAQVVPDVVGAVPYPGYLAVRSVGLSTLLNTEVTPFAALCSEQEDRLLHWQTAGIKFAGEWQADELAMVSEVLDQFAVTFGEATFLHLVRQALDWDPGNRSPVLTIAKIANSRYGAAFWVPRHGAIYFTSDFFDQAYVEKYHRWHVLDSPASVAPRPVTTQAAVIAHELGHVLIDGIRVAQAGASVPVASPEEAYTAQLDINFWPHRFSPVNESLATELGLWALEIRRPQPVIAFRESYLAPYLTEASFKGLAGRCKTAEALSTKGQIRLLVPER
jgi:hypothetical protein